jgi:hypothetical protein
MKLEQQLIELPSLEKSAWNASTAADVATLVSKIINTTNTPIDNIIIAEIKTQLDLIAEKPEPTNEETFAATMRLVQTITLATPTNTDDAIASVLSDFVELFGGENLFSTFKTWVLKIKSRIQARRAARNEDK